MVDAAATVRTAISQKEDDIEALRQRFAAIINEIASVYVDQPAAIDGLCSALRAGHSCQTLLGATGTGKTFTMANVIAELNRPEIVKPRG